MKRTEGVRKFGFDRRSFTRGVLVILTILVVVGGIILVSPPVYASHPCPASFTPDDGHDCASAPNQPRERVGQETGAEEGSAIGRKIAEALTGLIIEGALPLFGGILVSIVQMIIAISQYNDFVNSIAVVNGWVIVRDVANMFFVIVLLVIAFGTMLGQEEYHYKKLLPKLLLLAILVNFSRTLVGLMVDFAQVIMLTFVNGYKAAAGGNFANIFAITDLLKFKKESCPSLGPWQTFAAAILAFAMVMVSIFTAIVILVVLLVRIIAIWLLTILSPLAFLLGTFPQGQKYYAKWWEDFKNQAAVGPMLAFFLWLSLMAVGGGDASRQITQNNQALLSSADEVAFSCTAVGGTDRMFSFIIGTFMLLAGVQMAQEMGGAIAGAISQTKSLGRRGLGMAWRASRKPLGFIDRQQGRLTGIQFAKIPGRIGEALTERREKTEQKIRDRGLRLAQGAQRTVGAIPVAGRVLAGAYGALAAPDQLVRNFASAGFMGRLARGIQGSAIYKSRHADKAKTKREEAEGIDGRIKNEEQQEQGRVSAMQNLDKLSPLESRIRTAQQRGEAVSPEDQKDLNDRLFKAAQDFVGEEEVQDSAGRPRKIKDISRDEFEKNPQWQSTIRDRYRGDSANWKVNTDQSSRAYRAREPQRGQERERASQLRQEATVSEGKFARGETRYDTQRENVLFQQESEALKKIDLTRSTEELIGDLERAVAKRDKFAAALISKEIAKKGDMPDVLKQFGIKESGVAGLQKFNKDVLQDQAGLDKNYGDKTAVRMSEHAFKAGNADFANAYKVDPTTNEVSEQSPDKAGAALAKRWEGKSLSEVVRGLKPSALKEITPDGKERLSSAAMALLARVSTEPKSIAELVRRGIFPAEAIRMMRGQLGVLRRLERSGLRAELTESIAGAPVAPPGPSAKDVAENLMGALPGAYQSQGNP